MVFRNLVLLTSTAGSGEHAGVESPTQLQPTSAISGQSEMPPVSRAMNTSLMHGNLVGMSMDFPSSEIGVFEHFICGFTGGILRRAREIPEEKWNWSFSERTPTAREICEHAWMWLRSDRQEITVLDPAHQVAIPNTPDERVQMLDLLESEKEAWRELIQTVEVPLMDELRCSPDGNTRSVRGYLFHMAQHIVSKSGQMTMLHFELGLDGGKPYDAPHPNRLYGFGSPAWPAPRN